MPRFRAFRRFALAAALPLAFGSHDVARASAQFGSSFVLTDDLEGDGEVELVVADPSANENRGRLYLYHGADGELLRTIDGTGGMVDGNCTTDLALSLGCSEGVVRAISGASGRSLWECEERDLKTLPGNSLVAYGPLDEGGAAEGLLVAG